MLQNAGQTLKIERVLAIATCLRCSNKWKPRVPFPNIPPSPNKGNLREGVGGSRTPLVPCHGGCPLPQFQGLPLVPNQLGLPLPLPDKLRPCGEAKRRQCRQDPKEYTGSGASLALRLRAYTQPSSHHVAHAQAPGLTILRLDRIKRRQANSKSAP